MMPVQIAPATSNGRPTFHVAFCADDNYCRPMGATIASILANNPGQHFTFHLLAIALSDDNEARFTRVGDMPNAATHIHLLDAALFAPFASFLGHSHYSLSIFTRLVIPEVLKGQADRVLYLDADILCLGSLDALITIDFDGKLAVVVPDAPVTTRRRVAALGLPHNEYFNAGVMLINIDPWIAAGATAQAIDTLANSTLDLRFNDQDALNIVLNGRARYVDQRYNTLYDLIHDLQVTRTTLRDMNGAVLVHFAGSVKPWAAWSGHDAAQLFAGYLVQSPWGDLALDAAPRNTKEMRMHSRFLLRQWKPVQSLAWYVRYLRKRRRK
ncbi:MAG: UDP-glucose--(glucosyl) LPS alpha 1,3-glucosyltransferase WaaO [Pseudomonadota bacterium]|nr:UDP-glucose--(glucosyl) LPS alpha 1,3-glucosyltransferase WaaO [Pseudomonadota bacterium]